LRLLAPGAKKKLNYATCCTCWECNLFVVNVRTQCRDMAKDWTIRGSNPGGGKGLFSSPKRPDRLRGPTHPRHQCGTAISLGLKRPRREADHSPLFGAAVTNEWSCSASIPTRLHGVYRAILPFKTSPPVAKTI
jgi:hypothetical protein